jgi:rare lipoprotein A
MSKPIRTGLLACLLVPVAVFGREVGVPKASWEALWGAARDSIPAKRHHQPERHRESDAHRSSGVHHEPEGNREPIKVQYGIASYYANKFEGRKTYTDEIFSQEKLTGASNTLPMHTWVRVTNLRNHRTVILRINDKMHPRNRRLIDLSRAAAAQLGFAGRGLTRVRIDVLGKKRPVEAAP